MDGQGNTQGGDQPTQMPPVQPGGDAPMGDQGGMQTPPAPEAPAAPADGGNGGASTPPPAV